MTTPVILLMGPTASGKTATAVELVRRLPVEIVSVDSAMVYRGMDIGTAKPDAATLAAAPHRLIDILDPAESYSAARFVADAHREIEAIAARGRVPLLTGGTMLYFRAFADGLSPLPPADTAVRAELEGEAAVRGWPALHRRLAMVDPETAERLHPNDAQRIQRALEVHRLTGRPMSAHFRNPVERPPPGPMLRLAMAPPSRDELHRRIAERFQGMVAAGFIDEVAALRTRGDLSVELPSMRAVGYRQAWRYLDGDYDHDEMVRRGIAATRQFAKRQLTWLRRDPDVEWYDPADPSVLQRVMERVSAVLE